ncbi:MAG: TRAP transporter small permease subunit [Planctomycetota bacterium]|jgi:TRAP-type C4-dicarboxylate transport system permease small subunit|nr:TRAP transporter small permease subunit [Planctomycetota bacterium]
MLAGIRRVYGFVTAAEAMIIQAFVIVIAFMVFISAMARTLGYPLNWSVDISLLLLGWTVGLGGDLALRRNRVVSVDMIVNLFPLKIRKIIALLWCMVMAVFLIYLVKFGIDLCLSNRKRVYQTLQIGYIWATASVPTGAFLMLVTTVIRFFKIWLDMPLTTPDAGSNDDAPGGSF